jgi:hypothetical protein
MFVDLSPDDRTDRPDLPDVVIPPVAAAVDTQPPGEVPMSQPLEDADLALVMNQVRGFIAEAELHARMIPGYLATPEQSDANGQLHTILREYSQGRDDAALSQLATFRGRFPTHPLTGQLVEQGF